MRHVLLTAIVASLLLSGCGGGSEAAAVTSAWRKAVTEFAKGDPAACNRFTGETIRKITSASGSTCADTVKRFAGLLGQDDRASIAASRPTATVHGNTAEVHYHVSSALSKLGFSGTTHMQKSGGSWLVAPK